MGEEEEEIEEGDNYQVRVFSKKSRKTLKHRKYYECMFDDCKRQFAKKYNFMNHYRVHTGLQPFNCDICQRTFAHKVNMHKHRRLHTGNLRFHCPYCNKGFNERIGIENHLTPKNPGQICKGPNS
jgi:uncharacterized Zn-finger protein